MAEPDAPVNPGLFGTRSIYSLLVVVAVFLVCLVRLVGFVQDNAVDVLFDDQWDYLSPLFDQQGPAAAFFYQHGPPRMGLGNLVDWYLYSASMWDVRMEAWAAVVVLILTTITAIGLRIRLRGHMSWADAGVPLLLLSPIHWESMILTPSLGPMILPLFLTVVIAASWSSRRLYLRVVAVSICSALNLFTGYGICAIPVVVGLAALLWFRRKGSVAEPSANANLAIIVAVIVAAAVFSLGYRWAPAVPGWRFPVPNWWDYPRFWALMFSSLLGLRFISVVSVLIGGGVLFLVMWALARSLFYIWKRDATPVDKIVCTLGGTALVYAILTSIGRLPVNIEAAFMWRYMTLMTLGILALGFASENKQLSKTKLKSAVLKFGWFFLTLAIWCNFGPEQKGAAIANAKRQWVAAYLATHDLRAANQTSGFWVYFPDPASPRVAERLRWLEARHYSFFRQPHN